MGFRTPQAIIGMIAGIVVYVALYTWVWSSRWFRRRVPAGSLWDLALLHGTRLRSRWCCIGVCCLLVALHLAEQNDADPATKTAAFALLLTVTPDSFAGVAAISPLEAIGRSAFVRSLRIAIGGPDAHHRGQNIFVGNWNSLIPTFLTTLLDGLFLTCFLLGCSWLCLLSLRRRARREPITLLAAASPPL